MLRQLCLYVRVSYSNNNYVLYIEPMPKSGQEQVAMPSRGIIIYTLGNISLYRGEYFSLHIGEYWEGGEGGGKEGLVNNFLAAAFWLMCAVNNNNMVK